MQRILILLLTFSLFFTQLSNVHAQTDSTPPEVAPPEVAPPETEAVIEEPTQEPVGEPATVEESNSGGGSSGGGVIVAVAVVAAAVVIMNRRGKLEKTFVKDDVTGSVITSFSSMGDKALNWSIDYGSLSLASGPSHEVDSNTQRLNQQQILNWRINRSWENDWNTKASVGFSQSFDALNDSQMQKWFSLGVNKSNIFKSNDRLSLSIGQRFNQKMGTTRQGYFLPTTFGSLAITEQFDLSKNTVESGRYINLSYIRSLGAKSALNWQWHYSPKQIAGNYMTLNWQTRF